MKNMLISPAYAAIFRDTGEPTLRSTAELRKMQKRCVGRNNPNAFYATVDARPDPKVVWSYNTTTHFNSQEFTYKSFFSAVHPFWLPIYKGMLELNRQFFAPAKNGNATRDFILTANVPLRNKSGKYYWYSQVSYAGSFDERGGIVEYLSEFHRLAEFDRMVPAMQKLTFKGNLLEVFDAFMKEQVGGLLDKSLRELFSPACFKLLLAYRILASSGGNISREGVAKFLGISLQALDKGNVRLLTQARWAFPAAALTSVANFAVFLNELSGTPLQTRARL